VVLEKDEDDQLDRSCEKRGSITQSQERRNILHTIKRGKANRMSHVLGRNCLLKQVIEGKVERGMEVTGIQGRRRKQLLDVLEETRGYCK
jgi:hypothetical protein